MYGGPIWAPYRHSPAYFVHQPGQNLPIGGLAVAACLCLAGRETGGYRSQWVSGEYIIKNIQKCGRPFQVLFSSFVLTA